MMPPFDAVRLAFVPPFASVNGVVKDRLLADSARPDVKSETATFLVTLLCTIGTNSVPASGVVAAGSADIFTSAIYVALKKRQRGPETP